MEITWRANDKVIKKTFVSMSNHKSFVKRNKKNNIFIDAVYIDVFTATPTITNRTQRNNLYM